MHSRVENNTDVLGNTQLMVITISLIPVAHIYQNVFFFLLGSKGKEHA